MNYAQRMNAWLALAPMDTVPYTSRRAGPSPLYPISDPGPGPDPDVKPDPNPNPSPNPNPNLTLGLT
jgi:hypothetical protein